MSSTVQEINATPLIDVLLVLLIFLILMLPRSTHSTRLDLPVPGSAAEIRESIQIDVDFDGRAFWNGALIADEHRLEQWLAAAAERTPEPQLRISPDRRAPYGRVVQILAAAQRHHLTRLALDSIPVS